MKRFLMCCAVAGAIIGAAGCSSVQVADKNTFNGLNASPVAGAPIAHVSTNSYGLYLLWIPLITGSTSNLGFPTIGEDCANSQTQVRLIAEKAAALNGSKIADLSTSTSSVGLLFNIKSASASAVVMK